MLGLEDKAHPPVWRGSAWEGAGWDTLLCLGRVKRRVKLRGPWRGSDGALPQARYLNMIWDRSHFHMSITSKACSWDLICISNPCSEDYYYDGEGDTYVSIWAMKNLSQTEQARGLFAVSQI